MFILKCALCGVSVERAYELPRVTCFPCKAKAARVYAKERKRRLAIK